MFNKLWQSIKSAPKLFFDTVLRFPAAAICTLAMFIVSEFMENGADENLCAKLLIVFALGFILAVTVELLLESYGAKKTFIRIAGYLVVYLLLQAFYLVVDISNVCGFIVVLASFIAASAVALFSYSMNNEDVFESNVAHIILRLVTSFFFALVLAVGLCAIVGGINLLLLDIPASSYTEMLQISFLLFAPNMFLMGIRNPKDEMTYPKSIKSIISYIIIPLVCIFTVVLYIYYVKLIVTQRLPISETGAVSLAFLAVCLPSLILITPFENKLSKFVRKVFPYVLILVVAVLFLAAEIRILRYGITITRYYVVLGGIASLLVILLMIIRKGKWQRYVCLVVAFFAIVSIAGPLSAFNMTIRSQNERFEQLLKDNNMLQDGQIIANENANEKDKNEIIDIIDYFRRYDLGEPIYYPHSAFDNYKEILGFERLYATQEFNTNSYHAIHDVIEVVGYDYYINSLWESTNIDVDGKDVVINRGEMLEILIDTSVVYTLDVKSVARELCDNLSEVANERNEFSYKELSYTFENNVVKGAVLFDDIYLGENDDIYFTYSMLLSIK